MVSVLSFHRQAYLVLATLHAVCGCGHVAHDSPGSGGTKAAGGGAVEAGADNGAGSGGVPAPPVVTCGTSSRDAQEPIEICAADETCCTCGCGPDNPACTQEPACGASTGQRCGNDTCREGYICCNAICGICAKSAEDCTAVVGRCEAVGMDPSFDRCSDLFPAGVGTQSLGTLETLLARFRGRWLLCSPAETQTSPDDEVAGFDVTSDGRYFLLVREGDRFVRSDTPATRGAVVLPGSGLPLPELDFDAEVGATSSVLLSLSDDPKGLWLSSTQGLGGTYLNDPTVTIE